MTEPDAMRQVFIFNNKNEMGGRTSNNPFRMHFLNEQRVFDQSSANGWTNKKTARGIKNPRAVFLL